MATFGDLHRDAIAGTIGTFDRLIFKGHLNALFPRGAFKRYLDRRGILLKDAGAFFEAETARLKAHAKALADDSSRPFVYLNAAHTHATGTSKESLARRIAEDDGVTQGLVCAFSTLEPCRSFTVAGNRETKRLEVVRRPRRCLHFYWYLIDPEFGWMHVRLQSWAPYSMQVYVNGREWLARQLDRRGIAYAKSDNKITWVADAEAARQLCESFTHTAWPTFLDRLALMVNPLLPDLQKAGFGPYWWVIDQCEYATDLLFRERDVLETVRDDLVAAAMTGFGATDVLRFLDRKPHPAFTGEVTIDRKTRPEGCRVKFRLKANAIKFYDHQNVLRIETTINNPREFKVLRVIDRNGEKHPRWRPMGKSVEHFWRYAQVANAANRRLIDALANAPLTGEATQELDELCRSRNRDGTRVARFNPVDAHTVRLFIAVLSGEFAITGFRNRDLQAKLFDTAPRDDREARRRTHRTSRLIAKLRGHRLIAKVGTSRLYRVTARGIKAMWPAIRFRKNDFPIDFQRLASAGC
jgi:hypothetical protein